MFVAVSCELGTDDHRKAVYDLLVQYGFRRTLKSLFESATIDDRYLARLKRDIDRATDSYDKIRFYQYPMDGTLVISSLDQKKWRKLTVRP